MKFNYYTQDGHLMQNGEVMWRICDSKSEVFDQPVKVYFNDATGYNDYDTSKNPFAANHIHFFDKNTALEALKVKKYDSRQDTMAHINEVRNFIDKFISLLKSRANMHDLSKLSRQEKPLFDEMTPILKDLEYGSDEYKASLDKLKPALDHHYKVNRHHPQHFKNGVNDMTLVDIVEMYCDWLAAVKRTKDGDMEKSIKINQERFGISDQLTQIFINTYNREGS